MFQPASQYLKFYISRFLLIIFLLSSPTIFAQDGKALFDANCKSCHAINDVVIGPALKDVHKRKDAEWLHKWIKNSQSLVKAGDPYAVEIFNKFNKSIMPNQAVNDAEIDAILAWIKEEGSKAPVVAAKAAGGEHAQEEGSNTIWWVIALVAFLWALAAALGRVQNGLKYAIREKEGIPHPAQVEPKQARKNWIRANKKLIAVIFLALTVWGSVKGWYGLKEVGVTQDYQPEQPIKFSHKLHAGDNKIDCKYCHSGVEDSRHANIPSLNVCMNCHKYIKEGPVYGDQEIKKIYAALDWDGTNYGKNQKPVQWIRVHNLPDLAYFNHSQHIKVAKLECKQCHGDVETMDEVKQVSPLTMGWCIDCHRTTEVKMDGNGYYDKALHDKLTAKYGADAKLTVDKLGGIECARCHY